MSSPPAYRRNAADSFELLARERYISLTTFKRDGSAVSRPVWVASDDGTRLLIWSGAGTWKVKRLRRNSHVLVAASDFRGKERGPRLAGTARVLDDGTLGSRAIGRKYGWQKRLLDLQGRTQRFLQRRQPAPAATIAVTAVDGGSESRT